MHLPGCGVPDRDSVCIRCAVFADVYEFTDLVAKGCCCCRNGPYNKPPLRRQCRTIIIIIIMIM